MFGSFMILKVLLQTFGDKLRPCLVYETLRRQQESWTILGNSKRDAEISEDDIKAFLKDDFGRHSKVKDY